MDGEKEWKERMRNRLMGGNSFLCNFADGTKKEVALNVEGTREVFLKEPNSFHHLRKKGGEAQQVKKERDSYVECIALALWLLVSADKSILSDESIKNVIGVLSVGKGL